MANDEPRISYVEWLGRTSMRSVVLVALWIVLAEGDLESLKVGALLAVAAATASVALLPGPLPRLSAWGLARFVAFFAIQSFAGGTDVALRALHPRRPLDPSCLWYDFRLSGHTPRVVFANTLSLLPGTLSARFDGDRLEVHVLDRGASTTRSIAQVEDRVAALFGIVLPMSGEVE